MRLPLLLITTVALVVLIAFSWVAVRSWRDEDPERLAVARPSTGDGGADAAESAAAIDMLPPAVLTAEEGELAADPAAVISRIHGRCLNADHDRPIEGIAVRVASPGCDPGLATSDEEGSFALTYAGTEEVRAEPLPRRGLVPVGPPVLLDEDQREGRKEVVLHLRRGTSAPLQGRVVDERTDEPVFEVRVTLSHGECALRESIVTDQDGYFQTSIAFPPGELTAAVVDEPPGGAVEIGSFTRRHIEEGREPDPWELRVGIGPTFFVTPERWLRFPEGPWTARIVEQGLEGTFAAVLECHSSGFGLLRAGNEATADEDGSLAKYRRALEELGYSGRDLDPVFAQERPEPREWPAIPLREGSPRWARYPNRLHPPDPTTLPRLALRNASGTWWGEAFLETTVGRHPDVLPIPLRTGGPVVGMVADDRGDPVRDAGVMLLPHATEEEVVARSARTSDTGGFHVEDVVAGRYRLLLIPRWHEGAEVAVRVDPGGTVVEPIHVPRIAYAGDIRGELVAESGGGGGIPLVQLIPREATGYHATVAVSRWRGLRSLPKGSFVFRDVPSGVYDVVVTGYATPRRTASAGWTPPRYRVSPPHDGVRFVARADEPPRPHVFRARGPRGFVVPGATVVFGPEGWVQGGYRLGADTAFQICRGASVRWSVVAPGYRPARGTERSFHREDDRYVAEVSLDEGWGATLFLRQALEDRRRSLRGVYRHDEGAGLVARFTAASPVVSAKVLADGKYVGRTDLEGRIDLSRDTRPERIAIEYPGWRGLAVTDVGLEGVERADVAVVWLRPID